MPPGVFWSTGTKVRGRRQVVGGPIMGAKMPLQAILRIKMKGY